jgi:hypothetical protein
LRAALVELLVMLFGAAGFQLDQPAMLAMISKFDPDNSGRCVAVKV